MKYIDTKKILLVALIIFIIILLLFITIYSSIDKNQKTKSNITPTPAKIYPTVIISKSLIPPKTQEQEPVYTGANTQEGLPKEEADTVNLSFKLRQKLPLVNQYFSIEYDYQKAKYLVTIKSPYEESKLRYQDWLKENNYDSIPVEKFIIIYK